MERAFQKLFKDDRTDAIDEIKRSLTKTERDILDYHFLDLLAYEIFKVGALSAYDQLFPLFNCFILRFSNSQPMLLYLELSALNEW